MAQYITVVAVQGQQLMAQIHVKSRARPVTLVLQGPKQRRWLGLAGLQPGSREVRDAISGEKVDLDR